MVFPPLLLENVARMGHPIFCLFGEKNAIWTAGFNAGGGLSLRSARTVVGRDDEWLRTQVAAMAGAAGDR
jgi:hypothetical protein